jgi:hypothetical protein
LATTDSSTFSKLLSNRLAQYLSTVNYPVL